MVKKVGRKAGKGGIGGKALVALIGLVGCERSAPSPAAEAAPAAPAEASAPAPEQILTAGDAEVWFGAAREGRDSAGTACVERTLEIRSAAGRRVVPLLYTRDTPTVVNDSTIRARLFSNCVAGPTYQVDLRSGLPVRKDP
jgi:hypothetical protein